MASYGGDNDQARVSPLEVKRRPRVDANKTGVASIVKRLMKATSRVGVNIAHPETDKYKAAASERNTDKVGVHTPDEVKPTQKPKIVDDGKVEDLYGTGTQFTNPVSPDKALKANVKKGDDSMKVKDRSGSAEDADYEAMPSTQGTTNRKRDFRIRTKDRNKDWDYDNQFARTDSANKGHKRKNVNRDSIRKGDDSDEDFQLGVGRESVAHGKQSTPPRATNLVARLKKARRFGENLSPYVKAHKAAKAAGKTLSVASFEEANKNKDAWGHIRDHAKKNGHSESKARGAYSSWKNSGKPFDERHPSHSGHDAEAYANASKHDKDDMRHPDNWDHHTPMPENVLGDDKWNARAKKINASQSVSNKMKDATETVGRLKAHQDSMKADNDVQKALDENMKGKKLNLKRLEADASTGKLEADTRLANHLKTLQGRRGKPKSLPGKAVKDAVQDKQLEMFADEGREEHLPHGDDIKEPVQRGGSKKGSKAQKLIPPGGWQQKARQQRDGKGVDPSGKNPSEQLDTRDNLQVLANLNTDLAKELEATHIVNGEALNKEEWNLHKIQEARLSAARTHAMHLAMKTNCDCPSIEAEQIEVRKNHAFPLTTAEKPGMVMRGEPSAMYGADGKALEEDPMARKIDIRDKNDSKLEANTRTVENKQDSKGRITTVMLEMLKEYTDINISKANRTKEQQDAGAKAVADKAGYDTRTHTGGYLAADTERGGGRDMIRRHRRAEISSQIKHDKAIKGIDRKHKVNLATSAANFRKKKAAIKRGSNLQLEAEPTICSSLAVFNSILNKTEYDDKVVARQGKSKRSKRTSITNSTVDTAAQQINDTRGI